MADGASSRAKASTMWRWWTPVDLIPLLILLHLLSPGRALLLFSCIMFVALGVVLARLFFSLCFFLLEREKELREAEK